MGTDNKEIAEFIGISTRMWNYFVAGDRNLSYRSAMGIEKRTGIPHAFILDGVRINVVSEIIGKFNYHKEAK